MKKHRMKNTAKRVFVSALASTVAFCSLPIVGASAADTEFEASYINKIEGLASDYTKYLDSTVAFKLPDNVKDSDEISVIVTLDHVRVLTRL